MEIIRQIEEGTIMIEFKRNGNNNTLFSNRIPLYVGEFVYDESKESFLRNGRGYWIDEETRIATREVEWKDGVEEICMMDGTLDPQLQSLSMIIY